MKTQNLFILSFFAIITTYLYVFGQDKTIEMIKEEYLFIIGLFVLTAIFIFFKFKLKDYEIREFPQNNLSFKSTIIFFLIFQVVDYISEDGFIGMISQWFLYWIMGLIALVLMENINYYKNYKLVYN
jgi:Na+/H+ antiporter NhaC